MTTDYAAIDGILKEVYDNRTIENLQNMEAETHPKLPKSPKKPGGDGVFGAAIAFGNQRGTGSINELEALKTPATQGPKKWEVDPKNFVHVIRLSGKSMEAAKGNEESFADNTVFQMDNGIKDSAKELNAQCFRNGSGRIAQVDNAVVAGTTVTFDNGIPTHFRYEQYIDIVTAGGVKEADSAKIVDIDISNSQITTSANVTVSDDSWIYREDVADNAPTDGKEMAGFPRITDDGTDFATYEGITRTGAGYVPAWKGLEIAAGGANLSDDLLQRAKSQMKVWAGRKPNVVCSNTSQMRKYMVLTLPQVQFDQKVARDSGMTGQPTWNGIPWVEDTDCGFDEVYMYDKSYIERFVLRPLSWDDSDGKIIKWDNGYDAWVAFAKCYENIGTRVPRSMIRVTGLAVPTF